MMLSFTASIVCLSLAKSGASAKSCPTGSVDEVGMARIVGSKKPTNCAANRRRNGSGRESLTRSPWLLAMRCDARNTGRGQVVCNHVVDGSCKVFPEVNGKCFYKARHMSSQPIVRTTRVGRRLEGCLHCFFLIARHWQLLRVQAMRVRPLGKPPRRQQLEVVIACKAARPPPIATMPRHRCTEAAGLH